MQDWKSVGLEGFKTGRVQNWKGEGVEECNWKCVRLEVCKIGRVEI